MHPFATALVVSLASLGAPLCASLLPAQQPHHPVRPPTGRDTAAARDTLGRMPGRMQPGIWMRRMQEMHTRMMADPVIRERVATDPVLQRLMQGLPRESTADTTGAHAGHPSPSLRSGSGQASTVADTAGARQAMEFITLLLSDPQIEARVHADPRLRLLWSDPAVRRCLETMRRLKASGQPLPAACPAAPRSGGQPHPH